jgi:hypothetical protein
MPGMQREHLRRAEVRFISSLGGQEPHHCRVRACVKSGKTASPGQT